MFEKEAEEYANKKLCANTMCYNRCSFNSPKHHRCGYWHRYYECAKEGAEFGYNKCKEEIEKIGLALQSDMDKTIEQNVALKKELEIVSPKEVKENGK